MLHYSSSFHYCACYCALLCLLYQHQQLANSVTIIIDGATTNEWATRDEYQRLVDNSQGPDALGAGARRPADSMQAILRSVKNDGDVLIAPASEQQRQQSRKQLTANNNIQQQLQETTSQEGATAIAAAAAAATAPGTTNPAKANYDNGSANNQRTSHVLLSSNSPTTLSHDKHTGKQQQQLDTQATDELELALDQLDLIEQEQRNEKQRLDKLRALEQVAETKVVLAAAHAAAARNHNGANVVDPANNVAPLTTIAGARTISDLVPMTDADLINARPIGHNNNDADYDADLSGASTALRRLHEREEATPKKHCGDELVELLEMVCQNRFYDGPSEPQIVNPTITKRSVDNQHQQRQQMFSLEQSPVVARRKRLRTFSRASAGDEESGLLITGQQVNNEGSGGGGGGDGETHLVLPHNARINERSQHNHQGQLMSETSMNELNHNRNRNRHSRMAHLRRIRGASKDCCLRACYSSELKVYCKT